MTKVVIYFVVMLMTPVLMLHAWICKMISKILDDAGREGDLPCQLTIHRLPWGMREDAQVVIVHFGSKSTPMIAQQVREIELESRVLEPPELDGALVGHPPKVVILSGGSDSVYNHDAPRCSDTAMRLLNGKGVVVVGICYGAQFLAQYHGGSVQPTETIESGIAMLEMRRLFGMWESFGSYAGGDVVMNHSDAVVTLPPDWRTIGSTAACQHAFFVSPNGRTIGVQFHPEMGDTKNGAAFFSHVCLDIAGCRKDHTGIAEHPGRFMECASEWLRTVVGDQHVLVALSGGVDSTTAWALARRALGPERVTGVFVNNGFLNDGEPETVIRYLQQIAPERNAFYYADEPELFWNVVEAIRHDGTPGDDPAYYDEVRKEIGRVFAELFVLTARSFPVQPAFLLQGTNQSDVIEDQTGLKRHHNVGGLPERLGLAIIEPLAGLYKFEIRLLAAHLGLPEDIIWRQPSPGPGNAIRCFGPVTRESASVTGQANRIFHEVVAEHYPKYADRPTQYFVAFDPLLSRGLVGDKGVDGYGWKIRAVHTLARESYATVRPFYFTPAALAELEQRLTNEIRMPDGTPFVHVLADITGKPPATVEYH